jgi:2-polyprenyl-3-methyl-5-hydroxy-6-metoxy-1,4-benzoquinol methylase
MIEKSRDKITSSNTVFQQADITLPWSFTTRQFDLITFSLVLEHVAELQFVFLEAAKKLLPGGSIYVSELHPFKQYLGSKARFQTADGEHVVLCFNHHISDFTSSAEAAGLRLKKLHEYFDGPEKTGVPRILTLVFERFDN